MISYDEVSTLIKKLKYEIIKCDRVILKILRKEDVTDNYCYWLNNPSTNKYLVTKEATIEDLQQFVQERFDSHQTLFYGIFTIETNIHIGNIKVEPIDLINQNATMGILIGEEKWRGKGICKEVCKTLSTYLFDELPIQTIYLGLENENIGAFRCYRASGFKKILVETEDIVSDIDPSRIIRMKLEK